VAFTVLRSDLHFPLLKSAKKVVKTIRDQGGDQKVKSKYPLLSIIFPVLLWGQLAVAQNVHDVFLVRHAEQGPAGPDAALTPAGEKRAECLANMMKEAGIKQIYVTDMKRTQQTAAPLAKALKLTPSVIPAKDPNTLIRNLTYAGTGNVLVVGHSDTLPFILARMHAGTVPEIAANEYDRMFVVSIVEGAGTPAATLRYCVVPSAPATKPATKKAPATKKKG
jgi:phosphohistidine phosphatase SixA